jgi:hypothetical protein
LHDVAVDNRTLIAFGMLLALVAFALQKRAVDGNAVEKIVTFLAGGITGAMTPRAPTADEKKTATAVVVFILVLGALWMTGCATTEPYVGPPGPPVVDGTERLWFDITGKLRRETVLSVTNRDGQQLDAVLDCEPPGHGHRARNWMGSRFTLHVPPRTTQFVLLDPHDHICWLLPAE